MAQVRIPRTLVGIVREAMMLTRDPPLLVWSLFIMMMPFYVFNSGLPQPGDMLVVPLVILSLLSKRGRLDARARRPFFTLVAFTVWVLIVDWGWAALQGNYGLFGPDTYLVFPIYYVYNASVFLSVCILFQRYGTRFLWLTFHLVLFTVMVQAVLVVFHRGGHGGGRGAGFFNNPNQLGFYALVMASVLALGKRGLGIGAVKSGLGMAACTFLALISASRSAAGGIVMLFLFSVLSNPRRLIVIALVGLGLAAIGGPILEAYDETQQRLTVDHFQQWNFFEERGYDRILNNKQYLLLGAAEGGTDRFADTTLIGATEIHSSIATLAFCYGIVGLTLFGTFLWRVARGSPLRVQLMLLPALSYTVAHQGLRSTSIWIFFAMFVCIKQLQKPKRKKRRLDPRLGALARTPTSTPTPISPSPSPSPSDDPQAAA